MTINEQDLRLKLLNTLLTTPHRRLDEIWLVHDELARQDPRFYTRLAAWYNDKGDVRDHKEMFVVNLVLSDSADDRAVGLALLRAMPPYQIVRVVDFIGGRKVTRKKAAPVKSPGAAPKPVDLDATDPVAEDFGLFRSLPRSLRTEVKRYLSEREADADWFDGSVLVARKAIKRLYALLHVKPGERAQKILFDEQPPEDSRLFALRELARAKSPRAQANAIVAHRIPYRVAATVMQRMTPEVLAALVECMSPQEVINNLASLKRRGALDNPTTKELVEAKLVDAATNDRVSAFKAAEAVKVVPNLGAAVTDKLEAAADARLKSKGRINRPTALLIDKSGSMNLAIELGKRIGAMLSTVCDRELYVYAFDSVAYPVQNGGTDLAGWERALAGIKAGGQTSIGAPLEALRIKKKYVEQVIVVSDQEENTAPLFLDSLKKYRTAMQAEPALCFVRTPGARTLLEDQCRKAGMTAESFEFTGDYYALPNLIPLLAQPSKLELLLEILEYPLPTRRTA